MRGGESMISQKTFTQIAGLLFAVKGAAIIMYLINGSVVSVGTWMVPTWLMAVAVVIDAYLAYVAAKLTKFIK